MLIAGRRVTRTHAALAGGLGLVLAALVGAVALGVPYPGDGRDPAVAAAGSPAAWRSDAPPTPTTSPSPSASGSISSTVAPSAYRVAAGAAARGGSGARLRQVDGGPGYYGRFSSGLPGSASFFPIAVWYESVVQTSDATTDKAAGINTYIQLTNTTDLSIIRAQGMHAILNGNIPGEGSETAGWMLSDEADMWGGPGTSAWTGNYPGNGDVCSPATAKCGYTVQQQIAAGLPGDGRIRYTNYGKGVTFWDAESDAARFVNQYQNVVSADNYWFTDENICGATEGGALFDNVQLSFARCHRASNYGRTVDRLRSLVSPAGSRPVWGFVEVGHPFTDQQSSLSITPDQVVAAVWSTIIHGARGIIYFNHSFGGQCPTQHALREPCYENVRAAVTSVNARIASLAPVLNAPFADNVVTASAGVDASTKWYNGHFYVLAGANQAAGQTATFSLPCVGDAHVTVLNENRTRTVAGGRFTDRFADGNAVHIYRVDGGSSCGAY